MSKNGNYITWMICVALAALIVGFVIVSPGTIERGTSTSVGRQHSRVSARHSTPTKKVEPAASSTQAPAADPAASTGSNNAANPVVENGTPSISAAPSATTVSSAPVKVASYAQLLGMISEQGSKIEKLTFINGESAVEIKITGEAKPQKITVPVASLERLEKAASEAGIAIEARNMDQSTSGLKSFLMGFGPIILLIVAMVVISGIFRRRAAGDGLGGQGGFGKSKAKGKDELNGQIEKVTWQDIAGCEGAVMEVRRFSEGIVLAEVYDHFGGKRPSGVLLSGPPGTGKTLLAKAVAFTLNGTMDIVSGSDFVEMFVGVGASRVRDMVERGRANFKKTGRPHVIFIDEIDAIGGKRGSGASMNRNDEREQTLNALLVAMDGVVSSDGIIWMAATNRPDMLDDALLRPGRFDSMVTVSLPDKAGREDIFKIHTKKQPLAADVTIDKLAARSYGFSGAQIRLACQRAGLIAAERWGNQNKDRIESIKSAPDPDGPRAHFEPNYTTGLAFAGYIHHGSSAAPAKEDPRRGQKILDLCKADEAAVIHLADFDEAMDFVLYGDANPGRQARMLQREKKNTAYHEAGHAIVCAALEDLDPVVKVTIMNRARALGFVMQLPDDDRYSVNINQLIGRIIMAMAGRAAQEVYLGTCDTGASNDFQQATDTAYKMVTEWGMSRVGRIHIGARTSISGRGGAGAGINVGPKLADAIDDEWRRITDACYDIAVQIVTHEAERMHRVSEILLEKETILRDEWEALMKEIPSRVKRRDIQFDPRAKDGDESKAVRPALELAAPVTESSRDTAEAGVDAVDLAVAADVVSPVASLGDDQVASTADSDSSNPGPGTGKD